LKISLVIPVYNEADNIPLLCERLQAATKALAHEVETIIVNDGSGDRTAELLNQAAVANAQFKVVHLRRNFGQTAAIMAGINNSIGEVIVTMDGDLQNDPSDIPLLLEKIEEGYDVVSGWRRNRHDALLTRVIPSKAANWLISKLSGIKLNDYGCTLKAYRREVIKGVKLYGEMHRFIPIYASWQGARVTEIPVTHHPRKFGTSKYGMERTFKVILDLMVIKFLGGYRQKPIYVFGGFGLANLGMSVLCFLLMVYYKFWGSKSFIETPLPQLVVLFFLMGFMSILMGFLAELIMRTYYESQDKPVYLVRETLNIAPASDGSCPTPQPPAPDQAASR